jgi:hypothetical protein
VTKKLTLKPFDIKKGGASGIKSTLKPSFGGGISNIKGDGNGNAPAYMQ